jgi:hypothetical protein
MDIKVGSDAYATDAHESPFICEYNDEEGCFNDHQLLDGVEKITGRTAYLLDYEAGSFPIIEASPLHFLVDPKSDFFASGIPGRRNVVGIRHRTGRATQIVLSADFLRNGYDSFGGYVSGIEQNERFAEHIIDFLEEQIRAPNRARDSAYDLFAELERLLGQFVYDVLIKESSTGSIDLFLSRDLKKHLVDRKSGKINYANAYYSDIVSMLKSNWSKFSKYFGDQSDEVSVIDSLLRLNKEQRRLLAHPHKAHQLGFMFTESDILVLKHALRTVRSAVAAFKKSLTG